MLNKGLEMLDEGLELPCNLNKRAGRVKQRDEAALHVEPMDTKVEESIGAAVHVEQRVGSVRQ